MAGIRGRSKRNRLKDLENKKLIIFDLDGTLAESKLPADSEMVRLLKKLLERRRVAVIGGGKFSLFKDQLLGRLKSVPSLKNLSIFPTNGAQFYRYNGAWKRVYVRKLDEAEKNKIREALGKALIKAGHNPSKTYGPILEDRESQMTFSALGQKAPLKLKENWNKYKDIRRKIVGYLKRLIPGFEVRIGGLTSIDILGKGIDKAYGIRQIQKYLKIPKNKMVFVGDALFPGGNDYPALKTGVKSIKVSGVEETKGFIRNLLKNL